MSFAYPFARFAVTPFEPQRAQRTSQRAPLLTNTLNVQPAPMNPGLLIVFEGIDGAGKSTQVRRLAEVLRAAGLPVVTSREPTDGPWGQRIRQSALTGRMALADELHAFAEDRREHVRTLIGPSLAAGKVVLVDRYYFSSIAYQGARGGDRQTIQALMESLAPRPDLVFLLDLDPAEGLRRIAHGRAAGADAFEELAYLQAVRTIFLDLARTEGCFRVLHSHDDPEAVHREIVRLFVTDALQPCWGAAGATIAARLLDGLGQEPR